MSDVQIMASRGLIVLYKEMLPALPPPRESTVPATTAKDVHVLPLIVFVVICFLVIFYRLVRLL